jgi:hypothetical protein
MDEPSPIDREVLHRMPQTIEIAIATRSMPVAEAAAEARGLGRGMCPALPVSVIDEAVTAILRDLRAYEPPVEPVEINGRQVVPVALEDLVDQLAYIMCFDERGKARRTGYEYASKLAADHLVRQLLARGFIVMGKPRAAPHGPR